MNDRKRWMMVLMALVCTLAAAACEEAAPDPTAPLAPNGEAASLPTRTVKPIVSFTPRFTATPLPSATFTPSPTPRASDTPVPPTTTPTDVPTPTPTAEGEIRSNQNVNLRVGPGLHNDIARTVPPGTSIGVVGMQNDSEGRPWYKVAVGGEDGEEELLWVLARLVSTDYETIVAQPLESEEPESHAAEAEAVAAAEDDPAVTPEDEGNRVEVLAYCEGRIRPPRITTADSVYIEWSWYVRQPELMEQHLDNVTYEVRLDGQLLDDWEQYAQDLRQVGADWFVYWYYPVGRLDAGEHEVAYRVSWDETVTDGYLNFGPGTDRESETGRCAFTVTETG